MDADDDEHDEPYDDKYDEPYVVATNDDGTHDRYPTSDDDAALFTWLSFTCDDSRAIS